MASSSCSSPSAAGEPSQGAGAAFADAAERGDMFLAHHVVRCFGVQWTDEAGDGPLHLAARKNQLALVAWLLRLGPGAPEGLERRNARGETALLAATRLCRGAVALLLVEALADPGAADAGGETPEALDLDGLLREAEQDEHCHRQEEQGRALAAVAAARQLREEAEWRERLFYEMGHDDHEPFAGYEDLERREAEAESRDWADDIILQFHARRREEARKRTEERLRAAMKAKEQARAEANAQEEKARVAAAADAQSRAQSGAPGSSSASGPAQPQSRPRAEGPLAREDARLAARAEDDARWRAFEERVSGFLAGSAAPEGGFGPGLRAIDVPWPSGPPGNPLRIDAGGHPAVIRSQLRAGLLRWHPDKFEQRVAGAFAGGASEREAVLTRVKEIAQQLNSLMAEFASAPAAAAAAGPAAAQGSWAAPH